MMLKKILLATAILTSTAGIAYANTAPYIGAGLGIETNTSTSVATGTNQSKPGNFRGMPFNVFAGYGGVIEQSYYVAGELSGTIGTGEFSNTSQMRTTYGYGASIIPGLMLSDHTLAFARAGVVRTRFSDANKMETGGVFGLGLQTSLTQNVDVRGEYDFTAYRSFNNKYGRISAPRSDAFNLGLVYKFD